MYTPYHKKKNLCEIITLSFTHTVFSISCLTPPTTRTSRMQRCGAVPSSQLISQVQQRPIHVLGQVPQIYVAATAVHVRAVYLLTLVLMLMMVVVGMIPFTIFVSGMRWLRLGGLSHPVLKSPGHHFP